MKKLITLLSFLMCTIFAFCQDEEFKLYKNGLIYSEQAMSKLSYIADSLNLKFKICDNSKSYYSIQQVVAHLISLDTGNIKQAKKDMEQNISFEDFCNKYPDAVIDKNILVIKSRYTNYENKKIVSFSEFNLSSDYDFNINSEELSLYDKDFKNTWLSEYSEKTSYSNENVKAFYFPNNFSSTLIPAKYALMIGYADCLIDTSATKFKENLKDGWVDLPNNWTTLSLAKKQKLLDKMRSTHVVGFCSQDSRPREHAVNIALLAAETFNWEVFLKAHLDIMNDRFDRITDGSYAWGKRNTYIKELEELNINVTDLILGTCLRYEKPAENHYFGSINRVGRALSETKNKIEVEEIILSAIKNPALDNYNRLLFYFLYRNYIYYINDEYEKKACKEKLAVAITALPDYFQKQINQK